MDLPKFYNGIKFYNYYFIGMDKPIIIEARDKVSARIALNNIVDKLPEEYRQQKPCGETVTVPIRGISTKKMKDKTYIWVGEEKSANGWLEESELNERIKNYNNEKGNKRAG